MPKILNRIRQKQSPTILSAVEPRATDVVLQRLANASQLGILILAVFGYFYTVLPIYQKSLLDEEIAKKTIQLNAMEAEFSAMNKKVVELRASANSAREGLGKAKAEVGKLRGAVDTQYSELRPRLINDFIALANNSCKLSDVPDGGFANCIESKVLSSSILSSLQEVDRSRLLSIVRKHNAPIHNLWSDYSSDLEQRKKTIENKRKDADIKCENLKSGENYKDRIKKYKIDSECSAYLAEVAGDRLKLSLDEHYSWNKIISPAMSQVYNDFFKEKP
jgi:hypothetical protein